MRYWRVRGDNTELRLRFNMVEFSKLGAEENSGNLRHPALFNTVIYVWLTAKLVAAEFLL